MSLTLGVEPEPPVEAEELPEQALVAPRARTVRTDAATATGRLDMADHIPLLRVLS
jgi:hypothetical protein